ncbi:MAG: DUF4369 domain-containing protein [Prevotella sp.]|nr:DUF4369 domain-containing protein [Prevotella sp.]MBQ9670981.1 DUF4369 domain-containing protein [Prevotella sp.]
MKYAMLFGLALSCMTFAACQSDSYYIKGKAKNINDNDTLILSYDLKQGTPDDTIIVKGKEFRLHGHADSVRMAMVYRAKYPEQNAVFFIEKGNIDIDLSTTPLKSRVRGTALNDEWQRFNDSVFHYAMMINSTMENSRRHNAMTEDGKDVARQLEKIIRECSLCVKQFAYVNLDNKLGDYIISSMPEDILDKKTRKEIINKKKEKEMSE